MAIVEPGKTICPLCDQPIKTDDTIVSTSHFIEDQNDPFWRFSDAAIHKLCFLYWDQRETFVARFNSIKFTYGDGKYHHMNADGSISILKC